MKADTRRKLATIIKDYLPAIGVVGVVLYGLFRVAYLFFYLRLRATPEEVGYTYTRVVAESIVGAIELIVLCALAIAAGIAVFWLGRIAYLGVRRNRRLVWTDLRRPMGRRAMLRTVRLSLAISA